MVSGHQEAENETLCIRQGILQEPGSAWRGVCMCQLDSPCLGFAWTQGPSMRLFNHGPILAWVWVSIPTMYGLVLLKPLLDCLAGANSPKAGTSFHWSSFLDMSSLYKITKHTRNSIPAHLNLNPVVLLQRWGVALFVISSMVPLSTFILIGSCEWWAGDTCLGPGCWGRRNSQPFFSRNGTLPTITKWGAILKAGVQALGGLSKCETGRHWYLFI